MCVIAPRYQLLLGGVQFCGAVPVPKQDLALTIDILVSEKTIDTTSVHSASAPTLGAHDPEGKPCQAKIVSGKHTDCVERAPNARQGPTFYRFTIAQHAEPAAPGTGACAGRPLILQA